MDFNTNLHLAQSTQNIIISTVISRKHCEWDAVLYKLTETLHVSWTHSTSECGWPHSTGPWPLCWTAWP